MSFRALFLALAAIVVLQLPATASAQNRSESYTFLQAVRDGDGAKVTEILGQPGQTVINTKSRSKGEGALHIVVERNDPTYLRFLLAKGANPDIRNDDGDTPAMLAVENGFSAAIDILARYNADFNVANDRGETPLIRAVQNRRIGMVRKLLKHGADPDKTDVIAGMSARDYARRDSRSPAIAEAIEDAPDQDKQQIIGPKL